jgi:hypothetical protein
VSPPPGIKGTSVAFEAGVDWYEEAKGTKVGIGRSDSTERGELTRDVDEGGRRW